jgi:hypothetical protein
LTRIRGLLLDNNIELVDVFFCETLMNISDRVSRDTEELRDTWVLSEPITKTLLRQWHWIGFGFVDGDVDLFASAHNTKAVNYYSKYFEREALAQESLARVWKTWRRAWLNPPFRLLPQAIQKLLADTPEQTIVVTPDWTGFTAINATLRRLCDQYRVLEPSRTLFTSPNAGQKHKQPSYCFNVFLITREGLRNHDLNI